MIHMKKLDLRARSLFPLALAAALGGCDSSTTQVVEELEFAASLNVDLTQMEMLPSGVYIEDLELGTGSEVLGDSEVLVSYAGYLADGALFDSGQFGFLMGARQVIAGFEQGVLGMLVEGTRKVVIPPELAYGDQDRSAIPAGSVLVFDITVDSIS
jgi:FKBP-type peptidyl-prolyl cis-trans isomerase